MKITKLETIRLAEFPNIIWVRLHTDEGITGLGETFMGAAAVEAYLHEWAAQKLLGKDPLQIEARNKDITGYLGWRGSGVETRGNSAVDIALWDIFGKAANMPVRVAESRAQRFVSTTPALATSMCAALRIKAAPTGVWATKPGPMKTSKVS